jgi:3-hydroxyisobutyrate dehydrogenase
MKITVLGQGAMGSRLANRLAQAGHDITRWNRTGATQSPRDAVADADIVFAMLRDDEASRAVWLDAATGALAGLKPSALAVESSTLSVDYVRELASIMQAKGRSFVDAPVLGSRPQAEAGQLVFLLGGDAALVAQLEPVLAPVSAARLHAGPVGAGAALKLIANSLFGIQVAAVAELLGRMPALGLDPAAAIGLLGQTPVLSPAGKGAAALMLADKREPLFPIDLVAKDFRYALDGNMPMTRAALSVFETASQNGLAQANLTAVSSLYR